MNPNEVDVNTLFETPSENGLTDVNDLIQTDEKKNPAGLGVSASGKSAGAGISLSPSRKFASALNVLDNDLKAVYANDGQPLPFGLQSEFQQDNEQLGPSKVTPTQEKVKNEILGGDYKQLQKYYQDRITRIDDQIKLSQIQKVAPTSGGSMTGVTTGGGLFYEDTPKTKELRAYRSKLKEAISDIANPIITKDLDPTKKEDIREAGWRKREIFEPIKVARERKYNEKGQYEPDPNIWKSGFIPMSRYYTEKIGLSAFLDTKAQALEAADKPTQEQVNEYMALSNKYDNLLNEHPSAKAQLFTKLLRNEIYNEASGFDKAVGYSPLMKLPGALKKLQEKYGMSDEQMKDLQTKINYSDLKDGGSIAKFFNSFFSAFEKSARAIDRPLEIGLGGVDADAFDISSEKSNYNLYDVLGDENKKQIRQPQTLIKLNPKSPALIQEDLNPKAGKLNLNFFSVLNTIADVSGQTLGYGLGAKGIAAPLEAIGAGLKTANTIGTLGFGTLNSFEDYYLASRDIIKDEKDRLLYSMIQSVKSAATELIYPDVKYIDNFVGRFAAKDAAAFAKIIPREGLKALTRESAFDFVKKSMRSGIVIGGKEVSEELADQIANYTIDAAFNPQSVENRDLGEELLDTFIQTSIGMVPMSIAGGHAEIKNKSRLQKEALYQAGLNGEGFRSVIAQNYANGNLNETEFNHQTQVVNTMQKIVGELDGKNMSQNQKAAFAYNRLIELKAEKESGESTDPVIQQELKGTISDLQKERKEMLENPQPEKTGFDNPLVPTVTEGHDVITPEQFKTLKVGDPISFENSNGNIVADEVAAIEDNGTDSQFVQLKNSQVWRAISSTDPENLGSRLFQPVKTEDTPDNTGTKPKEEILNGEKQAIESWLSNSDHKDYISFDWDGNNLEIFKSRDEAAVEMGRAELIQEGVDFPETQLKPDGVPVESKLPEVGKQDKLPKSTRAQKVQKEITEAVKANPKFMQSPGNAAFVDNPAALVEYIQQQALNLNSDWSEKTPELAKLGNTSNGITDLVGKDVVDKALSLIKPKTESEIRKERIKKITSDEPGSFEEEILHMLLSNGGMKGNKSKGTKFNSDDFKRYTGFGGVKPGQLNTGKVQKVGMAEFRKRIWYLAKDGLAFDQIISDELAEKWGITQEQEYDYVNKIADILMSVETKEDAIRELEKIKNENSGDQFEAMANAMNRITPDEILNEEETDLVLEQDLGDEVMSIIENVEELVSELTDEQIDTLAEQLKAYQDPEGNLDEKTVKSELETFGDIWQSLVAAGVADNIINSLQQFNEQQFNEILQRQPKQAPGSGENTGKPVSQGTPTQDQQQAPAVEEKVIPPAPAPTVTAEESLRQAQAEYTAAAKKLTEAENKISKAQSTQTSTGLGGAAPQSQLFGVNRDEAKSILDPLRESVKTAKAALDKAQVDLTNAQTKDQPSLFDQSNERMPAGYKNAVEQLQANGISLGPTPKQIMEGENPSFAKILARWDDVIGQVEDKVTPDEEKAKQLRQEASTLRKNLPEKKLKRQEADLLEVRSATLRSLAEIEHIGFQEQFFQYILDKLKENGFTDFSESNLELIYDTILPAMMDNRIMESYYHENPNTILQDEINNFIAEDNYIKLPEDQQLQARINEAKAAGDQEEAKMFQDELNTYQTDPIAYWADRFSLANDEEGEQADDIRKKIDALKTPEIEQQKNQQFNESLQNLVAAPPDTLEEVEASNKTSKLLLQKKLLAGETNQIVRQSGENIEGFTNAKKFGYTEYKEDPDNGWFEAPEWKTSENVKLDYHSKSHKGIPHANIELSEGVNGKWASSMNWQLSTQGHGGSNHTSSADPFNTRQEALTDAALKLRNQMQDMVSRKGPNELSVGDKTIANKILKDIEKYNLPTGQTVNVPISEASAKQHVNIAYGSEAKAEQAIKNASTDAISEHRAFAAAVEKYADPLARQKYETIQNRTYAMDFKEKKVENHIGYEVNSYADIADLFSIYRSPFIEKVHYVYVKNGTIVGNQAYTNNQPGSVSLTSPRNVESTARAWGANEVYILHNHPSGSAFPSEKDIFATTWYDQQMQNDVKFKGHLVINGTKFSFIKPDGSYTEHEYKAPKENLFTERYQLPNAQSDKLVDEMVGVAYHLLKSKDYFGVVYMDALGRISGYNVISSKASPEFVTRQITDGIVPNQAVHYFVVTDRFNNNILKAALPAGFIAEVSPKDGVRAEPYNVRAEIEGAKFEALAAPIKTAGVGNIPGNPGAQGPPPAPFQVKLEKDGKFISFLKNTKKFGIEYFAVGGGLDKMVRELKEKEIGNLNEWKVKAKHIMQAFHTAVRNDYRRLTPDLRVTIDKALKGDQNSLASLKDRVRNVVNGPDNPKSMRKFIDSLTDQLIKAGLIPEENVILSKIDLLTTMAEDAGVEVNPKSMEELEMQLQLARKVKGNLGQYVNRAYLKYRVKNWRDKVGQEKIDAAVNYLYNEALLQDKEPTENQMKQMVEDLLERKVIDSAMRTSKMEMDLGILQKLKDIPPPIRDLFGEVKDGQWNFMNTAVKMAALLERSKFLRDIYENGKGKIFSDHSDPENGLTKQINNVLWGELHGKFTVPELAKAMAEWDKGNADRSLGMRILRETTSYAKAAKTTLSVVSEIRNMLGNISLTMFNGNFSPKQYKKGFMAIKDIFDKNTNEQNQEFIEKMNRLRIVGTSLPLHEIKGAINELTEDLPELDEWSTNKAYAFSKKVKDKLGEVYGATDDIYKIMTYITERKRLEGAYKKSGTVKTEDELDKEAADITLKIMPTFSKVPKFVKGMAHNVPFIGGFISYPTELLRTTWNSVGLSINQLKSPNAGIRAIGAKRLVWQAFVGTLPYITSHAIGMIARMAGVDPDDDEKDAILDLLPPFYRNVNASVIKRNGKYYVWLQNGLDGHSFIREIFNGALRGDDASLKNAASTFLSPYTQETLVGDKVTQWISNKDQYGRRIYNEADSDKEKGLKFSRHFGDMVMPQTFNDAAKPVKRFAQGRNPEAWMGLLKMFTGQSVMVIDPQKAYEYRIRDLDDEVKQINSKAQSDLYKNPDKEEQISKWLERKLLKIDQEMQKAQKTLEILL